MFLAGANLLYGFKWMVGVHVFVLFGGGGGGLSPY